MGRVPGQLESLGPLIMTPGWSDERCVLFLATELTPCPTEAHGPEEEEMEILSLPLNEALEMAADGRITDAKSVAALMRAAWHLGLIGSR